MEFWGVEVKSGEPLSVKPGDGMILHLSQANVGEVKKLHGSESVCLFVNVDGKKLVLGTLISDKLPQQQFDLIFDKDFELSHNWKNGNVYFYGFKAQNPVADDDDDQESDSDEDSPLTFKAEPETVVKPEKQAGSEKSDVAKSSAPDKKVKIKEPHKDAKAKEDESSDEDMGSDDDDLSDEDMDSSDGEDEDESDETPKKVESGKKRLAESAKKTPASDKNKKAKMETPQKTGGKKSSVHVATPYPSKQAKTAANKPNQSTPKSAGSHACKSCNRTFGSEGALDSHTKAKHSSGK
ncbi:PREDICTED: histone deacetylase HDT1-like isoform X2 [Ipomoea nil]|uniref:histone deacetylase HDT1-like isoform X2 n=1 Tax=Ipomoea nil TaxID=35883 RepID=UPI0009015DC3|nr:PREDICTED: histone deacetylase HDT1-like isoform X2 [Ipomoea nil]